MNNLYISLILLASLLSACQNNSHSGHETSSKEQETEHHDHSQHAVNGLESPYTKASAGYISEMSLYNLKSKWARQDGDSIQLESLKGKVQIVAMIYTSCDYACPRIMADLKRIEESLLGYKKEETGFVLVTIDPERDKPGVLNAYARKNKLDTDRWVFLTGEENNILELAALLNVKYRKELSMDIAHSNIISVLDKEGELIHQQEGLGVDPEETVKAITTLLKKI